MEGKKFYATSTLSTYDTKVTSQAPMSKRASLSAVSRLRRLFHGSAIKKIDTGSSPLHIIHIQTTLNNTIITLTDFHGNTKASASSGFLGFKNSRKSTTYASQTTAEYIAKKCLSLGIQNVEVKLKGLGFGKESSLRGLQSSGIFIKKIEDVTSLPHNGCRLPKKRRL